MARAPDSESEAQGMMDLARDHIEGRRYPVLGGPGPLATVLGALAIALVGFTIHPQAETFLGIAALAFFFSAGTALRLRSTGRRSDFLWVSVTASVVFAWGYAIFFEFSIYSPALHYVVLISAVLVAGVGRFLRCYRYSWSTAIAAADACDADTLGNYAEYLLDKRPGPAAAQVAREFYRLASEEVLYYAEPAPRHTGLIKRYIDLLRTGVGGHADVHEAAWWMERVRELENGVGSGPFREIDTGIAKSGTHITEGTRGDGKLRIRNGRPAWRLAAGNSAAAANCPASISFQAFLMPEGGVLSCLLCLHDNEAEPTARYLAFNPAQPETEAYLMALEHRLSWRLEIMRGDGGPDDTLSGRNLRARTLGLEGSGLMESLDAVLNHNAGLGIEFDGAAALDKFTAALNANAREQGLQAGWTALDTIGQRQAGE